jgi:hypothetical protein
VWSRNRQALSNQFAVTTHIVLLARRLAPAARFLHGLFHGLRRAALQLHRRWTTESALRDLGNDLNKVAEGRLARWAAPRKGLASPEAAGIEHVDVN